MMLKTKPKSSMRLPKDQAVRPMHNLMRLLPRLCAKSDGQPDFKNTSESVLSDIATNADACGKAIHLGLSAVGTLMAYAAPEIEDGTISSDTIEALGWLLAELGELGAVCSVLSVKCARARDSSGSTALPQ